MPLYEYQCENCGERFETMQKFADAPLTVHEKCGGPVHRLISAPALQFKGSGWYVTDYAKSGGSGSATNGESQKKSDSGDGSGSKESAPAKTESTASSTKSSDSSTSSTPSKAVSDKK